MPTLKLRNLGLFLLVTACGDNGATTDASTSAGPTTVSDTLQPTSVGPGTEGNTVPTSTTQTSQGTGTGTATDSGTGNSATEAVTITGTGTGTATETTTPGTSTTSTGTTGPDQLCTPGAVECVDGQSFQTCGADGQSWEGPTACDAKLVCEGGMCVSKCEQAEVALSSIGCKYYAIDANNDPVENFDTQPYAVAVSNVDPVLSAEVQIQAYNNGWQTIQMASVAPKQLTQFMLPDRHVNNTNINVRGAYRILSDIPIIAYQFQPINGQTSFTSDASLLLPSAAYDSFYYVLGWGADSYGNAQLDIVASQDNTQVMITPTSATNAGGPLPALPANQPYALPIMNEGDVIQIETETLLAGTYITSDKPIAVFSTHWCANVPNQICCCDHLEEQLFGLQKWGTTHVASRWPVRNNGTPEESYWQIIAAEDSTTIKFLKHAEVTGIAQPQMVVNKGQVVSLAVGGSVANPGDFLIDSDKPIFVMQYLSSASATNAVDAKAGDPAMAQAVPAEQYRSDYIVLVPSEWIYDFFVVTKKTGTTVNIDGAPIAQNLFTKVGPADMPTEWEVARLPVTDGVHALDGDAQFGVIVLGYDSYDSYAYPGGLDQKQINPQ